jgi:hypothetical protein
MVPAKSRWLATLVALAAATLALAGIPAAQAQSSGPQTIFKPTYDEGYANPGVMYARTITLHRHANANGTMLTTFEVYTGAKPPVFPIYESTDGGGTWAKVGEVADTVNGHGMRWNPQIYELPERLGSLPAGTILVSGLSVPADQSSTEILLFASTDRGRTWSFLSSVAKGGAAYPWDPNTPVWEPFLLMHKGKLIVFYSDQRQNSQHSQKLVHQVSRDGRTWGPIVDDVSYADQKARPGMSTVTPIGGGRWILTYEYCGHPAGSCPVFYRISSDPEKFLSAPEHRIVLNDGNRPCCQPYVIWTPSGGPQGTIVVGSLSPTALAVNTAGGDPSAWRSLGSNTPSGYSRSLLLRPDGNTVMTITGGEHDSNYLNTVEFAFDHVAPGLSTGATYTLLNVQSRLALGAKGAGNGAAVVQQTASGATRQQWVVTRQPNGYFTLTNVAAGRLLTVVGGSTARGAKLELRAASPGLAAAQEWAVAEQSDGGFQLVNRKSDLVLDNLSGRRPGTPVAQTAANGGTTQRWNLTQTAFPDLTAGEFTIQNAFGKYLEIPGGATSEDTQADQWWYANQPWHLWRFAAADGGHRIINSRSGLALTDTHPGPGDAITQTAVDEGDGNQVWTFVAKGNRFLIKNVGSTGPSAASTEPRIRRTV